MAAPSMVLPASPMNTEARLRQRCRRLKTRKPTMAAISTSASMAMSPCPDACAISASQKKESAR